MPDQLQPTYQLLPGEIAPTLDDLYQDFVTQLASVEDLDQPPIEDIIRMLRWCPISGTCVNFGTDRGMALMGRYTHPDKRPHRTPRGWMTIAEWVISNFASMVGSIYLVWENMLRQCFGLGCAVAELKFVQNQPGFGRQWRLHKIKVLPRRHYEFAGFDGDWDRIILNTRKGPRAIPREKLLHIYIPDIDNPEDPRGYTPSYRAYPFWKARSLAYKSWQKGLKKQATGTWVIKAPDDQTTTLLGADGQPLRNPDGSIRRQPAVYAATSEARKLLQDGDGSVFGTSKNNDVQYYGNTASGGLGADANMAITSYKNDIMFAYGIPKTILDEGTAALGQAGLNFGHRLTVDTFISAMVTRLQEQMLEQVVRKLLRANYGRDYEDEPGSFVGNKFLDPSQASMRVSNVVSAAGMGFLDANDIDVQNRVREDCGLSPITQEDYDQKQVLKVLQQSQSQQGTGGEDAPI